MEQVLVRLCESSFIFFSHKKPSIGFSFFECFVQGSDVGYDNIVFDVVNMNNLMRS